MLDFDSVQENSNQVPELVGIAYDGLVANSAGEYLACTVRDCTVELATLQLPRLNTTLRLATSRDVSPVASGSGLVGGSVSVGEGGGGVSESDGEAEEPMDLSGRSDDSDLDSHYVPPRHPLSSSESETDTGASFTTSRKVKAGGWRLRLNAPAKISKLGRGAAKVSWKTCEVLGIFLTVHVPLLRARAAGLKAARQYQPLRADSDSGDGGQADQALLAVDPVLPDEPAPAAPAPVDPLPVQAVGLQVSFQQILVLN